MVRQIVNIFRLMVAACLLFGLTLAHATVPTMINYQGFLTNPTTGAPLNTAATPLTVSFNLWDAASTGTGNLIYSEKQSVTVNNGVFNVQIGTGAVQTPPNVAFTNVTFDKPYWLEIIVGSGGTAQTLTPRQALASSAYALHAALADNASTSNTITGTIAGSQVTGAITTATIPGSQVTGVLSNVTVPGVAPWVVVSGASQQAASNTAYIVTGTAPVIITLPTSPTVGDTVKVSSPNSSGFTLARNAGQTVVGGNLMGSWIPHESARAWGGVTSSADGNKLAAIDFCGSYVLGSCTGGYIYTSSDGGVTWTPRDSPRFWTAVASSSDGSKLVALEGYPHAGQIYTSTDSGVSWTPRDSARSWKSVASSGDGTQLVAVSNLGGMIYTSTDSGATWTPRDSSREYTGVASSADGTKLAAVTNFDYIYTSTDSGVTWTPHGIATGWSAAASSSDGTKLVATEFIGQPGNGGLIYTSTDSGVTWTSRDSVRQWTAVASSADGSKLLAASSAGLLYTSTDSGITWIPRDSTRSWRGVASSSDGSKLVAVAAGSQIYTGVMYTLANSAIGPWQNSSIELVYSGSGQWIVINQQGLVTLQ